VILRRVIGLLLLVSVSLSATEVLWGAAIEAPAAASATALTTGPDGSPPSAGAEDEGMCDDCPCLCACGCAGAQPGEPPVAEVLTFEPVSSACRFATERHIASIRPDPDFRPPAV